jgi:DNA-binding transcriptional MerR regulator
MSATRRNSREKTTDESHIPKYTMGITVRLTGVAAGRIRKYEEYGLLEPQRTSGRQRLFCDGDIELIQEIARLENEGANLEGIKIILAMRKGDRS